MSPDFKPLVLVFALLFGTPLIMLFLVLLAEALNRLGNKINKMTNGFFNRKYFGLPLYEWCAYNPILFLAIIHIVFLIKNPPFKNISFNFVDIIVVLGVVLGVIAGFVFWIIVASYIACLVEGRDKN